MSWMSSRGSVLVTFDLWFHGPVTAQQVQQELRAGLQSPGPMVIDSSSIQITGRHVIQTSSQPKHVNLHHSVLEVVRCFITFNYIILVCHDII